MSNWNLHENWSYMKKKIWYVAKNFWGQASFLKIGAKILFFFDDKTTCWHYSGFLSRACSLTVIMITFFLYMPPWVMQKKTVHFSFTWSFKSAFLMFESRYKRNWTLYYEPKVSERGDSAPLLPTCKWRTLFSKKEHPI